MKVSDFLKMREMLETAFVTSSACISPETSTMLFDNAYDNEPYEDHDSNIIDVDFKEIKGE